MSATCDMDKNVDFLPQHHGKGKRRACFCHERSRYVTRSCLYLCAEKKVVRKRDRELDIKIKVMSFVLKELCENLGIVLEISVFFSV